MKKEYINCKNAMTLLCPSRMHKDMLAIFCPWLNKKIIGKANNLCENCENFEVKCQVPDDS